MSGRGWRWTGRARVLVSLIGLAVSSLASLLTHWHDGAVGRIPSGALGAGSGGDSLASLVFLSGVALTVALLVAMR